MPNELPSAAQGTNFMVATSPLDFNGKTAVVTGAGSGIGFATCKRLLEFGASVVMCVHDRNRSAAAIEALAKLHSDKLTDYACDVGNHDEIAILVKDVYARHRRIDILINNAGILRDNLIGMISHTEIDEILAVNLSGALQVLQGFARIMKRNKSGSIVNISSIVGVRGNEGQLAYSASKAGLLGATYSAAKELASSGIRVNAIAPGLIDTKMIASLPTAQKQKLQSHIGMGRVGTPEEVADVALFSGFGSFSICHRSGYRGRWRTCDLTGRPVSNCR